jgi:hypothetical protein
MPWVRASAKGDSVEVPMKFVGAMPAVEVVVNGKGPFLFGIDTGGQGQARVDSSLMEKLELKPTGEIRGSDGSGRNPQAMQRVRLQSIEIGGLRFADVEAGSRNYRAMPRMSEIDGILTVALFANYLITLDYPAKLVRIAKGELAKADGAETLDYKSSGGIPMLSLRIGDADVPAHIDSGNMIGGFVLPRAVAEKLTFAAEPATVGHARSISGEVEIKEGRMSESARLGRYEFPQPAVTFPAPGDYANIGAKVLSDFAITFDAKNERVRFVRRAYQR